MTRALVALALAFACLAVLALTPESAEAREDGARRLGAPDHVYVVERGDPVSLDGDIDADGRIPEYFVCGGFRGFGLYTFDEDTGEGVIRYNVCRIHRLDHHVAELRETIAHERAHARGFEHRESTPRRNPSYYP